MILGVVLPFGAYNAPRAFHDLLVVDVSVVTHLYGRTVIVIHLAVYVVVACSLHLYVSSYWVVHDAAFTVLRHPVRNAMETCWRKCELG